MWVNVNVTVCDFLHKCKCVCLRVDVKVVHVYLLFQACCDARRVRVIVCYVPFYIINRQYAY